MIMKIISRYIIKEHIPPFIFSLAVLMFIFLMQFMLKYITKIFGKGLSIITIIELVFYNLAWMFALAVPMAVLIATLMSFGRLSGDNEITILKSSGISIYRIISPALFFGATITLVMIFFNDKVLPDFNHRARVMFRNISQKKATLKLEPGIFFTVGKYIFHVEKIEQTLGEEISERMNILGPDYNTEDTPEKLLNITIYDRSSNTKTITIIAEEGYMVYSVPKKSLIFTLFNGEYHELDNLKVEKYSYSHFGRTQKIIPAPEFALEDKADDYRGDREMDVAMMISKVKSNRNEIDTEFKKIMTEADKLVISAEKNLRNPSNIRNKPTIVPTPNQWKSATTKAQRNINRQYQVLRTSKNKISSYQETINRYLVEIHKKFSIPFASIVFILIGAPLGIASRKGSLGVGATLSILFFLVYWACLILGEDLADRKLLTPFLAMWFPNIIIGFAGFYLTWRTVKERTFFNWDKVGSFIKRNSKKKIHEVQT
jgi:lipopolysaccharide export system permease protein